MELHIMDFDFPKKEDVAYEVFLTLIFLIVIRIGRAVVGLVICLGAV